MGLSINKFGFGRSIWNLNSSVLGNQASISTLFVKRYI